MLGRIENGVSRPGENERRERRDGAHTSELLAEGSSEAYIMQNMCCPPDLWRPFRCYRYYCDYYAGSVGPRRPAPVARSKVSSPIYPPQRTIRGHSGTWFLFFLSVFIFYFFFNIYIFFLQRIFELSEWLSLFRTLVIARLDFLNKKGVTEFCGFNSYKSTLVGKSFEVNTQPVNKHPTAVLTTHTKQKA